MYFLTIFLSYNFIDQFIVNVILFLIFLFTFQFNLVTYLLIYFFYIILQHSKTQGQ